MIVAVFTLIIAKYKNDALNLKSSKKILNLSLIYVLNYLKILLGSIKIKFPFVISRFGSTNILPQ